MKKLALFLVLCLLSAFGVAYAEDDAQPEILVNQAAAENGQALLKGLGLEIPSYSSLTDYITREDFVYVMMQLINFRASGNTEETIFEDVSPDSKVSSFLNGAVALGIVSNAQNFEPDRQVLYAEAMKMTVVALGYAYDAISYGGYPYGYLTQANRLGLTKNIRNTTLPELTYGDFFILMQNMCETDLRIQTAFGETNDFDTTKGVNILTEYFDLYEISGIIEADSNTSLYDYTETTSEGFIKINTVRYQYDGDYLLGSYIKGYARDNSGTAEIVYIYQYKTATQRVDMDDFIEYSGNLLRYTGENDKEEKLRLETSPAVIYNGKAMDTLPNLKKIDSGYLYFVDNNNDEVFDIVYIYQNDVMLVSKVDARNLYLLDANKGTALDLSDHDMKYEVLVNGITASLRDIKSNTIANCYISEDKLLASIQVTSKTVTGKVTALSTTERVLYIDGEPYKYTSYFETYYSNSVVSGTVATLLLDDTGKIAAVSGENSQMLYGYLFKMAPASNIGANVQAKIFNQNGKMMVYDLAQKVVVDAQPAMSAADAYNKYFVKEGETLEQLLRIGLNGEGQINVIDTEYSKSDRQLSADTATTGFADDKAEDRDKLIRYSFPGDETTAKIYYKSNGLIVPYFALSTNTTIFNISLDKSVEDEKRCSMITRSYFSNDQQFESNKFRPYNVGKTGVAEVMVFRSTDAASSTFTYEPKNGLVKSVVRAITEDDQSAVMVTVYTASNVFEIYYITDEALLDKLYTDEDRGKGELPLSPGDYIRFDTNANNEISVIAKDFDASQKKILEYGTTNHNSLLRYYFGTVYANEGNFIMLADILKKSLGEVKDGEPLLSESDMNAAEKFCLNVSNNVAVFNSETGSVSPATLSEVISYLEDPNLCSQVFIRSRWASGTNMVIYK